MSDRSLSVSVYSSPPQMVVGISRTPGTHIFSVLFSVMVLREWKCQRWRIKVGRHSLMGLTMWLVLTGEQVSFIIVPKERTVKTITNKNKKIIRSTLPIFF